MGRDAGASPRDGDWVTVDVYSRRWEAEMAHGLLQAEGIPARLRSDDTAGIAYPNLGLSGGYPVLVPAADLELAREALAREGAELSDADLGERLAAVLLELLAMPCVTGQEAGIADWLARRYRREPRRRVGNSLVVGRADPRRPSMLLVAHLDVVAPTEQDRVPRREDERIVGRGASDMKAGLAVAMDCFEDAGLRAGPWNLLLVAYAGEEGPQEGNELPALLADAPELADAGLAVVLEPTDLRVQLGCLGGLQAELAFSGLAAHSARPWHGHNALTQAGDLLRELHTGEPSDVVVDGLVYREVLTATDAWVGRRGGPAARNVVPDRFTINLNYRFAPSRTMAEAEAALAEWVGDRAEVTVVDRAPAAAPRRDDPAVAAFVEAVGGPVEAKQAWTDVARLAAAGVPALNYGPGLTAQAHQAGEWVPLANLTSARRALGRFLRA